MRVYLLIEEAYTPEDADQILGVYATPEAAMAGGPDSCRWVYKAGFGWRSDPPKSRVTSHRIDEYEVQG